MRTREIRSMVLVPMLLLGGTAGAQVDSSEILFSGASVRDYTLHFYDASWDSLMQADYAAGGTTFRPARFTDGTLTLDSVGVRYKGNSSYAAAAGSRKKPLKIKFGAFRSQTYYGAKTLDFSNGNGDPTMMREKISYDIARRYDAAPRASFAVLRADTMQFGLYTQVEQADKTFLKRWYSDAGGNLFKAGDDGSPLSYLGEGAGAYDTGATYELKTNETANDWTGFVHFVKLLDRDTTPAQVFASRWPGFLDADNVARYLAFNMVMSNFDSYTGSGRNYYLYQTSDSGAMRIIPWDLNLAFGAFTNGWNVYNLDPLSQTNLASRPLCARVLENDSLRVSYLRWIRRLALESASTDSVQAAANRIAALIRPYVGKDSNKFYDSAAFETNISSKYYLDARRTTSVPGLVEFSRTRNAFLLAAVDAALGSSGIARASSTVPAWDVSRSGRSWILTGPSGSLDISILRPDGRRIFDLRLPEFAGSVALPIPSGLSILVARSSHGTRTFLLDNLPSR